MANCPTPHIAAMPEDFGKVVLMPGDPLRSEFIAKNYLKDAKLVNNVRGVQGYTGTYQGETVSVMASGMGMPSIGIYSYELFRFFDVDAIIRVGSAGSIQPDVKVMDLILGMGASCDTNYGEQYGLPGAFAPLADYGLLRTAAEIAAQRGERAHVGNLLSTGVYYYDDPTVNEKWAKMGVLGIEMEAAALYMNAARLGKKALTVCTVSNNILTGEETPVELRQTGFGSMIEVALETAVRFLREKRANG